MPTFRHITSRRDQRTIREDLALYERYLEALHLDPDLERMPFEVWRAKEEQLDSLFQEQ